MTRAAFLIFLGLMLVSHAIYKVSQALAHITVNSTTRVHFEKDAP